MISRILVATDGSATAQKAAKYAVHLAQQLRASIIILSVIDNMALVNHYSVPPQATANMEFYLKKAAEKSVEKVERLCEKQGIRSKGVIYSGHPADEIVKHAERSRSHLIIMGSHGKRPLAAMFLGSITYGVIHRDTKVPVLIIRK